MLNINITSFRRNIFSVMEQTVKHNQVVNVSTKDGDAVIISAEDYNSLMETLHLTSVPGLQERILEGMETPLDECIPADEVDW